MFPYLVITDICLKCDNCNVICPEEAILKVEESYTVETFACTLCSACIEFCPVDCIKLKETPQKLTS